MCQNTGLETTLIALLQRQSINIGGKTSGCSVCCGALFILSSNDQNAKILFSSVLMLQKIFQHLKIMNFVFEFTESFYLLSIY
jgi:hypothetical protein